MTVSSVSDLRYLVIMNKCKIAICVTSCNPRAAHGDSGSVQFSGEQCHKHFLVDNILCEAIGVIQTPSKR